MLESRFRLLQPAMTHSECLEVVHAHSVAEQVEESILEHATVTVPGSQFC